MFFFFSKLLAFVLHPVNWLVVFLLVLLFIKRHRKKIILGLLLLTYVTHNSYLASLFSNSWAVKPIPYTDLKKSYKVGIMLGGTIGHEPIYLDRIAVSGSSERIFHTIELYQKKYIAKILITGQYYSISGERYSEAEGIKRFLVSLDIPVDDIIVENDSRNTRENAVCTFDRLESQSISFEDCLLITSALHITRARACFENVGGSVAVFPTDFRPTPKISNWTIFFKSLFTLKSSAPTQIYYTLHEIVGYWIYYLKGYI